MDVQKFVDRYVAEVVLDDPALLCEDDMWPWFGDPVDYVCPPAPPEDRAVALAAICARAGEMKRFQPGEELAWIKTISGAASEWMYKHARHEPVGYHLRTEVTAPVWPNSMTVRHTSALGVFLEWTMQVENLIHVHNTTEREVTLAMRALVLAGLPFGASHPDLQNAYRRDKPLDPGSEAFCQGLAEQVTNVCAGAPVPPQVAACVTRYPSIWRSYARDYRKFVCKRKYRNLAHHEVKIELDWLMSPWTPEAVVAMDDVCKYHMKAIEHRRTFDTDYTRLCIAFLGSLGLWERVAKVVKTWNDEPFKLEDSGER